MKCTGRLRAAVGILCLLMLTGARAAALVDQVQLVSDAAVVDDPVPAVQTFTIAKAGSYTITLTDLQLPVALSSLSLAIVTPTTSVAALEAAGTKTVTLAAGTYTAQVLALAAQGAVGGTFGVQIVPAAGGAAVWQYEGAVGAAQPPPSSGQAVLSAQFSVTASGNYQLTVTDQAFPAPLASLTLIVLNDCGTTVGCVTAPVAPTPIEGPNISSQLTLAAGTYDLFVVANAAASGTQGLYSVQITGGTPSAPVYTATVPVGLVPAAVPLNVPATGTVSVKLTDLATPQALASLKAIVTQGNAVLQQLSSAGTQTFAASAGVAQLYVVAQPGSAGQGAYEAYATEGSQVLADTAQPVLATGQYGYAFPTSLPSAGAYQASLYDFQLPKAFSSLTGVIAQAGVALTTTQGTASFTAAAGPIATVVFPDFPSGSSASNGLFSVQLANQTTGTIAFETTQGVGAQFNSQTVTVGTAGSYDLTLTDLGFPAAFTTLALVATRGDSTVGEVFGAGKTSISATPGTYVLNVLAEVGSAVDYGLYGLQMATSPPAPTVTLGVSSNSITAGQSVTLTWNSAATSGCAASSNPVSSVWTGALPAISGSESSGALTTTTTFSITCTGTDGTPGTASVSVTVNPAKSSNGGGGGAMSSDALLALSLALILRVFRQRTSLPSLSGR